MRYSASGWDAGSNLREAEGWVAEGGVNIPLAFYFWGNRSVRRVVVGSGGFTATIPLRESFLIYLGGQGRRIGAEVCHSFQERLCIRLNEQGRMVRFEKKLIFGDGLQERLEVVEKTVDVQNAARFVVKPELEPGEGFEQFFERSDASGKSNETVAEIHHQLFALVHGVDDTKVSEPGVSEFSVHQRFGDDADDMSSGLKMGIRDDAHETEVASAVNQPDSEVGH